MSTKYKQVVTNTVIINEADKLTFRVQQGPVIPDLDRWLKLIITLKRQLK